jgi:hypothetical protein
MAGSPKLTQKNGRRFAGGKPIPKGGFALPPDGYPIDTPGRARDALSRAKANATPAQQAQVRRAVKAKYPSMQVSGTGGNAKSGGSKPAAKKGASRGGRAK